MEIQGSQQASYYPWQSGTIPIDAYPGQYSEVNIRTRMTITSGETQGWSFGLEPDAAQLLEFQASGGYLWLGAVTTTGTSVETLNPSVNSTAARSTMAYTQGIIIDTSQQNTLAPTSDFVTSLACYRFTVPYEEGYWVVRLKFTHDVGSPKIRTVVTQDSQSNVPCARNLDLIFIVGEGGYYGSCNISGGSFQGATGPETGSGLVEAAPGAGEGQVLGQGAPCQAPVAVVPFKRGDSNSDQYVDISDPLHALGWLFLGGPEPGCKETVDVNDDNQLDITDPIYLLSFLFLGTERPPEPFLECGGDSTGISSGCSSYPPCPLTPGCSGNSTGTFPPDISQRPGHQSETAVAIFPGPCDPLDPSKQTVFVLSNDWRPCATPGLFRAVSWDGGASWPVTGIIFSGRPPGPAPAIVPAATADPTVAFDSFGNLYAAFNSTDGCLRVAVSTDGGLSFPPDLYATTDYDPGIFGCNLTTDHPKITTGPAFDGISQTVWVTVRASTVAPAQPPFAGILAVGARVSGLLTQKPSFKVYRVRSDEPDISFQPSDIAVGPQGEVLVTYNSIASSEEECTQPFPTKIFVHLRPPADLGADPEVEFGPALEVAASNVCGINGEDFIPARPNTTFGVFAAPQLAWDQRISSEGGRVYLCYLHEPVDESNDTEIFLKFADPPTFDNWLPAGDGIRVAWDDDTGRSQFFQRLAVDQTTGNLALSWYDAREDSANTLVKIYATFSADRGMTFAPSCAVSGGTSDGTSANEILGDYIGLAFHDGFIFPVWADNSPQPDNSDGFAEVLTKRLQIPICP